MLETLGDVLRHNARILRDDIATVFGGQRITFGEHFERCQQLASALAKAGLKRQERIAVLSFNSNRYLEIYGAAELAGFLVATVNYRLAPPEILYILNDSAPSILFFEGACTAAVEAIRDSLPPDLMLVCVGDAPVWATDYESFVATGTVSGPPFRAELGDIIHLIYTSGTTGRPKGVVRSHAAELAVANLMTTEVGVLNGDIVQIMMPLFHVGARWLQLGAHQRGARVILHREFDVDVVLQTIERERVTLTHMAPTLVQRILDHPDIERFDLSSLRTLYYSAAPMPLPLLRRGLDRLGPVFVQLYGMTEGIGTTLHKRHHILDGSAEQTARLSSVGQVPCAVGLKIVDREGNECPTGQAGEILLSTETRMSGYWSNSIATFAALVDGWYRTGDIGRVDGSGFLYLVDRKKDMIISGGENIYCREVEDAIISHGAVVDVAVIGVPDSDWGESVRAFVVLKPGRAVTDADIIAHCRTRIASYKKPKSVIFIDEMPRLTTGKINKVALRQYPS